MRGLGVTRRCACLMHGHRFAKETQLAGSKSLDIAVYRTIYLFFFFFFFSFSLLGRAVGPNFNTYFSRLCYEMIKGLLKRYLLSQ